MICNFTMSGAVMVIQAPTPIPGKEPSTLLVVQYGENREIGPSSVNFVNATYLRTPARVIEKLKGHLAVGCSIDVIGHFQGVLKTGNNLVTELIADRITIKKEIS